MKLLVITQNFCLKRSCGKNSSSANSNDKNKRNNTNKNYKIIYNLKVKSKIIEDQKWKKKIHNNNENTK